MAEQMSGDFIGFSFGGVTSSELGIVRTSDGSRYNENLLPTIQDKIIQVPGGDGSYYFGSYYTQKPFNISIAFDNLTDEQLRKIKQTFGSKTVQKLSFDERPDVFYWAKSTGTPNLKFICFDDGKGNNIYKGEGTISLVAYDPFGYSEEVETKTPTDNGYSVTNSGDLEGEWRAIIKGNVKDSITASLGIGIGNSLLELKNCQLIDGDNGVMIDSKTQLVYGIVVTGEDVKKTTNIYNAYLNGNFFKIPVGNNIDFHFDSDEKPNTLYYSQKYY